MFLSPTQLIEKLNITKSSTVVDFGSGSGAYVYPSLKAVSKSGKVIAVDIDGDMLKTIESTATVAGHVLHILRADLEKKIILPDYTADYVIFANTLHQIENKEDLIREIKRILTPSGLILFVEWSSDSKFGPKKEIRIAEDIATDMFVKAGFSILEKLPAGDYHYAYIFKV